MPNLVSIIKNVLFPGRGRPESQRAADVIAPLTLTPLALNEFLALDVPPREMLLDPVLPERSLSMLYAPRGLGKSWLALSVGLVVASGGAFLRWRSPKPRTVLYVDGEMNSGDLQARLAAISAGLGVEMPNEKFSIIAADNTEGSINLSSAEGQAALEPHLDGIDLLIADNLSTLTSNSENGADAWLAMQNWLLRLRRKGVAVLIVHHAGINGRQRGTSRREDALDTVIALRRPANYSADQGARFEVVFEKLRQLAGEGALPFEACVEPFAESGKRGIRWVVRELAPPVLVQAAELFEDGMTVRAVAIELGISRTEAGRLRKLAVEEGLFVPRGKGESPEPEGPPNGHSRPN